MKFKDIARIGAPTFLATFIVCLSVALWPAKHGIRIPVHCADKKMGYIDDKGAMIIAPEWDYATPFNSAGNGLVQSDRMHTKFTFQLDGYIPKLRMEKWRYGARILNRAGSITSIPRAGFDSNPHPRYHYITKPDSQGMAMVRDGRNIHPVCWMMKDGKAAFPGNWDKGINFKDDDPAAVQKEGKWGFINRKGETVIPFEWDNTSGFDGRGRACVSVNNKWGVINPKGELVVPLHYDHLTGFDTKNMCGAKLASGCGFIDPNGKTLIPFRYQNVDPFDNFDMARVFMNNNSGPCGYGWIDRLGKTVIPCIYEKAPYELTKNFTNHELLPVSIARKLELLDRTGHFVVSGDSILTHIEDPSAPGRFWITSIPDNYGSTSPNAFKPACYDQYGTLIWQGDRLTRSRISGFLAAIFGIIASILYLVRLRKSTDTN